MRTRWRRVALRRSAREPDSGGIRMSLIWMHVAELAIALGEAPMKNRVWEFDLNRRWSIAFNGYGEPRGTSEAWARCGRAPLRAIPKYALYLTYDKVPAGVVLQVPDPSLREPEGWLAAPEIEMRVLDAVHECAAQLRRILAICSNHRPQHPSCAWASRHAARKRST